MTDYEKELRKTIRQWERVYDWMSMKEHYGAGAALVNMGRRPTVPARLK